MPQFEVENRGSYYKSYTDLILSGSPTPTNNSWGRGVLTSKISGSTDPGTDPRYKYTSDVDHLMSFQDFVKEYATPYFDRGSVRNVKLTSANSYFEDSRTPEVLELYTTGSLPGKYVIPYHTTGTGKSAVLLLFATNGQVVTASFPAAGPFSLRTPINNRDFCFSFPYEKKYAYVPKFLPSNFQLIASYGETVGGGPPYYYDLVLPGVAKVNDYSNVTIAITKGSGSIEYLPDWTGYYNPLGASSPIFGTAPGNIFEGGGRLGTFSGKNQFTGYAAVFGIEPKARYKILNGAGSGTMLSAGDWNFYASYGLEIRGWKYGLYNGVPTKFSAVYRRGRYGQCRDMLEQRIYTKSFNQGVLESPFDTNGGVNFISGSALAGESDMYLTASIYAATNMTEAYRVNPYGSGLFDIECRASQPWFDNDPRVGT